MGFSARCRRLGHAATGCATRATGDAWSDLRRDLHEHDRPFTRTPLVADRWSRFLLPAVPPHSCIHPESCGGIVTHSFEHAAGADVDRIETIRRMAYERWDAEGRPEGRDVVHWLEAEQYYLSTVMGGAAPVGGGAASTPLTHRPRGFRPRTIVQTGAQKNG